MDLVTNLYSKISIKYSFLRFSVVTPFGHSPCPNSVNTRIIKSDYEETTAS